MYIYKTINLINGKCYVGKCKFTEDESKDYLGSGLNLKRAIKKYGRENFIKEIIEMCFSIKQLNSSEIFWIDKLNTIKEGYNISYGGNGGNTRIGFTKKRYELWIKRKSNALKGKPSKCKGQTRETHSNWLQENHKNGKYSYEWLKKSKSEEHKKKISESNKGKHNKLGKCPHCNKEMIIGNLHRWHLDNCKLKGRT